MSDYLIERAEALAAVLYGRRLTITEHPLVLKSVANGRGASLGAVYAKADKTKTHRRLGFYIGRSFRQHMVQVSAPFYVVAITRVAPRTLDSDNLESSLKALRDGIAKGLGIDDRDALVRYVPDQVKGKGRPLVRVALHVAPPNMVSISPEEHWTPEEYDAAVQGRDWRKLATPNVKRPTP